MIQNVKTIKMNNVNSKFIEELVEKLDVIHQLILQKEKEHRDKWLNTDELALLLKVSKRTIQKYRSEGLISFSQVGDKIYYKLSDVDELLNAHYHRAVKKN